MLARFEQFIGPDDAAAVVCLLVLVTLIAMTAINWVAFWVDVQ